MAISNIGNGLTFNPLLHAGLLADRGTELIHEICILCTCRNGDVYSTLQKDGKLTQRLANCKRCAGEMWLYREPVIINGFVTSIRSNTNPMTDGLLESGDLQFGSGYPSGGDKDRLPRKISLFDKLTATWPQPVDGGQIIVRSAGSKGIGGQFTTLEPNEDKLWYEPHSAIWCEDENNVVYKEGDFILGPGRVIKWVGNKPVDGVKYTFKYNAYFEWIVFTNPQERVDKKGKDIGQSVSLKKKVVVFINDSPNGNDATKHSLQQRSRC